jgi:hypothetical protein
MPQNREWKLRWSWKGVAAQLAVALAAGKFVSFAYHLNWLASSLWLLAGGWFAIACTSYSEESLSYFDSQSGTFQPRFQKSSRFQIFATYMSIAFLFGVLGVLVQIYGS